MDRKFICVEFDRRAAKRHCQRREFSIARFRNQGFYQGSFSWVVLTTDIYTLAASTRSQNTGWNREKCFQKLRHACGSNCSCINPYTRNYHDLLPASTDAGQLPITHKQHHSAGHLVQTRRSVAARHHAPYNGKVLVPAPMLMGAVKRETRSRVTGERVLPPQR